MLPEMHTIYEPGDTFATIDRDGFVRVWKVLNDGLVLAVEIYKTKLRTEKED